MATTNLGRVRFNMRGDYNHAADPLYSLLDLVSDGGGSFVYINDTPSNEPTSSTSHWQQIAEKGDTGDVTPEAEAARDAAEGYRDSAESSASAAAASAEQFHVQNTTIKPLFLKTPFEYNEPLHPSVLYFATGWNGYKFWMVETPLPLVPVLYRDRYECPCIHASNNGIDWVTPTGLTNPIDDLTAGEITNKDYFSDPSLVYRSDLNRIEVWYRITRASDTTYSPISLPTWLVRKYSTDGVTWSEREVLNNFNDPESPLYPMVRSPSVLWDGAKYQMWYVDGKVAGLPDSDLTVKQSNSPDGVTWGTKYSCTLSSGYVPWHIDVQYSSGEFHMINYTLGADNDGVSVLSHYASVDGINWNFVNIIDYSRYNFVSKNKDFYKSCAVRVEALWYAYITVVNDYKVSIALMIGDALSRMQYYDGTENDNTQVYSKGIKLAYSAKYGSHPLTMDYRIPLLYEKDGAVTSVIQNDADGDLILGSAVSAPGTKIYGGTSGSVEICHVYPYATKVYNLGSVTKRFNNIWAGGSIRLPLHLTANRPIDADTGAMIFDINLGKPIFHNGTNWIDAAGNIV